MREDMHEVLVERPRGGMRTQFRPRKLRWERKCRSRDGDDALPARMPTGFATSKSLNENLRPLRRYLLRQAGRPWDKVHSEIRARLDAGSVVKAHVLQHLFDDVLFARREGERIVLVDARGRSSPWHARHLLPHGFVAGRPSTRLGGTLYVSLAGILTFVPSRKHRQET